ncbi:hypothetical protein H5410_040142 [Solanum commersonii]|uniref:At2g35280-like TPR domain-containing protein n=1 Tax=Solanum commersonii TaxID=4109 RepID=A0A9J5XQI1_SOLCO|nr:hypothetical protein H5410_040142 [Solanum commersonii]
MVSTIYPASHYACCMRHFGENIRNNFHNSNVVSHFYKAAKAYDRYEFNDHFNQIKDLVPKAAETLKHIRFHTWSRALCRKIGVKKNYIESFPWELLIDIVERIASYSVKDLMNVRLSSRVLNQVANEPFVYQKVTLVNLPYRRWSIVQEAISFLEMCKAPGNLEALYKKGVFDFFNHNDPNAMRMINQAANGGHIGAFYVLSIISIFKGGGMWVPEPHLLGERPIYCTIHQLEQIARKNGWPRGSDDEDDIRCELCSCDLELDYGVKFLPYTTSIENLEALYRKCMVDYFHHSNPNGLGMLNYVAYGGDIGTSYVLAIISIFKGGESMREGLMLIVKMRKIESLKLRRYGQKLRYILFGKENACNFFRWRDREDVDIRSKFVILRLANRIKELEIDDESHIKRSNKWVMKEKKKTTCCNN